MLADGKLRRPGVNPPELLAREKGFFEHMTRELAARGVEFTHAVERAPRER
jgi:saccharopine dehydrogenase-like NADP-dependent oxidoreductase